VVHRWRRWRKLKPAGLLLLMAVAGLTVTGAYGASLFMNWSERDAAARFALNRGVEHFERGDYDRAIDSLNRGVSRTDDGPGHSDVSHELRKRLKQPGRARSAADMHTFVEQARFLYGDRRDYALSKSIENNHL